MSFKVAGGAAKRQLKLLRHFGPLETDRHTDIQTDRQTDRQKDFAAKIQPSEPEHNNMFEFMAFSFFGVAGH